MPFLLAEILNFQGSTHRIGVGSFSKLFYKYYLVIIHSGERQMINSGSKFLEKYSMKV